MIGNLLTEKEVTQWNQLVSAAQQIVILGHHGPDGDAIGSCIALALFLKDLGKKAKIIVPNDFAVFLKWLPSSKHILTYETHAIQIEKEIKKADLVICLDFNTLKRVEVLAPLIKKSKAPRIMVDHHQYPEADFELIVSHPEISSTSEMIFRLIWQLKGVEALSKDMAVAIYTGMMTDTGGFTYNSNDPTTFFIIAQLLAKGINKDAIYKKVFHNYSVDRLRLMGYIMHEKLEILAKGKASIFTLSKEEQEKFNYVRGDSEGMVNMPLTIKGVQLSIYLREDAEQGIIRLSLRSEDTFPCNKMATEFFNGGGHYNAAGGFLSCTLEEATEKVKQTIEACQEWLN